MDKPLTRLFLPLIAFVAFVMFPFFESDARVLRNHPETVEELKQSIEDIITEHNVPGVAFALVSRDEQIWIDGIGFANIVSKTPVDENTIFRWGSVSKSFVAVAVQMLAERGLVSLDDKIGDLVPDVEFYNRWESTNPVRLVHCLEHTTGFDDLHFNECAVDDPDITLTDALAIGPNARQSRWKPGQYKSYCNVGPVVAAYAVETVTGQSFEDFVEENVFGPLGMRTASFYFPAEADLMSTGYGDDGVTEIAYDHIVYRPAGSLNSSAKDMAAFVQTLLNRGTYESTRLIIPQSIERMETPTTTLAARDGFPLGYGLGVYTTLRDGYVFYGHEGMIAGFSACYGYNADLDRGFAVSINKVSDTALQQIVDVIVGYISSGIENPALHPMAVAAEDLAPLTGYYQSMTPMSQLMNTLLFRFLNVRKITLEDGVLYSGNFLFGKQQELMPIAENGFYRKSSNECLSFVKDGNSQIIAYDSLRGNFKKVSGFWIFFQLGAFILSLLLMISSLLYAVIWIPKALLGKMKGVTDLKARLFTLLSVLFFFVIYISLLNGVMKIEVDKALMAKIGFFSIYSLAIFLSSICFVIFAVLGLYFSARALVTTTNRLARMYPFLVSIVNLTVAIYLWFGNVIGIATWSY